MKHKFKSTKEVYGVDPTVLSVLPYSEALKVKLTFVRKEYTKAFNSMVDAPSYEEAMYWQRRMDEFKKAESLCLLQLQELNEKES